MKTIAALLVAASLALPGCIAAAGGDDATSEDSANGAAAIDDSIAGCASTSHVIVYTQDGFNEIAQALAAAGSKCTQHYISLPSSATDKTTPRGPAAPEQIRALGPTFHALAEFHWSGPTGWAQWVADHPGEGWYGAGKEFRKRMLDAGYDVASGDTWAINEAPSTLRSDPTVRAHLRAVVEGLYDGIDGYGVDANMASAGVVFTEDMGSNLVNFSVYKPNLEELLSDGAFWQQMNLHVRFFAEELYALPSNVCVAGASLDAESSSLDAFTSHLVRLARAGGAKSAAAKSYLDDHFVPMLNATYQSPAYGTDAITREQAQKFFTTSVRAARASNGALPEKRVGFAWTFQRDSVDEVTETVLAKRAAEAVTRAYDAGGSADAACDGSTPDSFCGCAVSGASFNSAWQSTFATW